MATPLGNLISRSESSSLSIVSPTLTPIAKSLIELQHKVMLLLARARLGTVGIPSHSQRIVPSRRRGISSFTNFTAHAPLRLTSTTFPVRFQMDDAAVLSCEAQKQEEGAKADEAAMGSEDSQDILLQGRPKVALYLFALGLLLGSPLDGIHSRVQLQIYHRGALDIAGLHTNIWVFHMLGLFYSVVGVLQLVLDRYLASKGSLPTADLKKVGLEESCVSRDRAFLTGI